MTTHVFSNAKIVQNILIQSNNNGQLSMLTKRVYSIAQATETKIKWILRRKKEMHEWIKTFKMILKTRNIFRSLSDWLAYQVFPALRGQRTLNCLLKNEDVLLHLLKLAHLKELNDDIAVWWNALAAQGSSIGLGYALKNPSIQKIFERNVELLNGAIFVCLGTSSKIDLLQFFVALAPSEKTMKEVFEYGVLSKNKEVVNFSLNNCPYSTVFNGLIIAESIGATEIEQAIFVHLLVDQKNNWNNYKKILNAVEKDEKELVKNLLVTLIESRSSEETFVDKWTGCISKAIDCKSIQSLSCLLEIDQFASIDLYIPINIFFKALETNDVNICDLIIPFIDCMDHKIPLITKLNLVLEEYAGTSQPILYSRLYPLTAFLASKSEQREILIKHQIHAVTFLVQSIRAINSLYLIPSSIMWKAIQMENQHVADTLKSLGGIATWFDTERQNSLKPKTEYVSALHVEDAKAGMFQAYGGQILSSTTNFTSEPSENLDLSIELEKDVDYSLVQRLSVTMDTEDENLSRAMTKIPSNRYSLNRRPSSFVTSNNSVLGSKKVSLRNEETSRITVHRSATFANIESDRLWNLYFSVPKQELERELSEGAKRMEVEWMERKSDPVAIIHDYNIAQELPILRELSQLY